MAQTVPLPAPRPQLADDVAAYVRDLIVSGQVRSGEFLRLESLAAALGTSITPVREALLALRGEGFVTSEPRRGFRVASFTRQDVADVYLVQSYLAGELAARACEALDRGEVEGLEGVQADLRAAHRSRNAEAVERLNHDFHRRINRAAAAPKLTRFLVTATRYSPRLFFARVAGWAQASVDDHDAVLAALADRDAARARAVMAEHVTKAGALLADHLERQGVWAPEATR
jgi:DNA-binding GntR family transcriptional regulator